MANKTLNQAKSAKEDEFYTRLEDIEAELYHYQSQFKGKTVICNCDDPRVSNFNVYFKMAFETLGLKRLICTCYKNNNIDLFHRDVEEQDRAVYSDYDGTEEKIVQLKGDGDFRSKECLDLLDEADIVVTNPPFSLIREFILLMMEKNKKFLIIGPQTTAKAIDIFPLFMNNKIWIGYHFGDLAFRVPADSEERESRFWIDQDGTKWRSMGNVCWYTNLVVKRREDFIDIYKKYSPSKYQTYQNYDAIDVKPYTDIPFDYDGVMGVPLTYLCYHCPKQFEIIGSSETIQKQSKELKGGAVYTIQNGKLHREFTRIFIRNLHPGEEF